MQSVCPCKYSWERAVLANESHLTQTQMKLIKEMQLIIVSQDCLLIADRLCLVLKMNLSALPAFLWERQGLATRTAGAA